MTIDLVHVLVSSPVQPMWGDDDNEIKENKVKGTSIDTLSLREHPRAQKGHPVGWKGLSINRSALKFLFGEFRHVLFYAASAPRLLPRLVL